MKGNEAEYVVPFRAVFKAPKGKRARRAIVAIRRFVRKHTRVEAENVKITADVNKAVWAHANHIPRRIAVVLKKDADKVVVYLKGSKQIDEDKKKLEAEKKKKLVAKRKKEKEKKAEKKKEEEKDEEKARKLEEKREKEKAMAALEAKRK